MYNGCLVVSYCLFLFCLGNRNGDGFENSFPRVRESKPKVRLLMGVRAIRREPNRWGKKLEKRYPWIRCYVALSRGYRRATSAQSQRIRHRDQRPATHLATMNYGQIAFVVSLSCLYPAAAKKT